LKPLHLEQATRRPVCAIILATLALVWPSIAGDGYWITSGGGSWAAATNWDTSNIADGTDNTAYFGFSFEAVIPSNATFTLDGTRTIGNLYFTTQTGPDNWVLETGTGGPLTLDATFGLPQLTVTYASQSVAIEAVLAGATGAEKTGAGTLALDATNIYTGQTRVSAGTLLINGQTGADGVTVAAGLLGGTGMITGPVTVQAGAILSPGNPFGTLTISNLLTLQAGSTTLMAVNAATSVHAAVHGLSNVAYGGMLEVSNLAGTLLLGQSFSIFDAASQSGNFSTIGPNPGPWLRWRFLPAGGVLQVVSSASPPRIAAIMQTGTNVVLSVTNGPPGATAYLLTTTNLALTRVNWARIATNVFDSSGSLTLSNALAPDMGQRFYSISAVVGP
jgi:autotransporter-associated beta strand protein